MLKGIEWPDQLRVKRKMKELQVNLPKRKENLLCIGSKFSFVQVYFPFTREFFLPKEKYTESSYSNIGRILSSYGGQL